jgi:hypothetical protein
MALLALALVVFYGLFTPFWFALRALAWTAEFRARRAEQGNLRRPAGRAW